MASHRLKPSPSRRDLKERVEPEQFVISEVTEKHYKEGVEKGARIVWITTGLIAFVMILVFLTAAFIAIPEWRHYLPDFLNLLSKALEGIFKSFK